MKTIKYPLATEKSIRLMESMNTLIFIVDKNSTKKEIKGEIEKLYNIKTIKINTSIGPKGLKRAYIRFADENPAIDLATQLGLM